MLHKAADMPLSLLSISPVMGGVIAGALHIILGPDHLCSIVTLSACQGAEAFWFGVRWASGHITGMAVIGTVVATLNAVHAGTESPINFELYEHYAYYCVGFLLMFMGAYFIMFADKYFDAEWAPKQASCACHAPPQEEPIASKCHDNGGYGSRDEEAQHSHDHDDDPADKKHGFKPPEFMREKGSVLVGFAQGIACPAGAVGMVFLKQYSPMQMVVFLIMFFTVTTLAMGLLAMSYGLLTKSCVSSKVLGRTIYYVSCSLSLTLGALWVYLNWTHRLDAILGHDHDHGHDHAHEHGHHHHHMMMQMQEDVPIPDLLSLAQR